jgi:hypothetical protein
VPNYREQLQAEACSSSNVDLASPRTPPPPRNSRVSESFEQTRTLADAHGVRQVLFDRLGTGYLRPFELATLRLQVNHGR